MATSQRALPSLANGTGGESIYCEKFNDEVSFQNKHPEFLVADDVLHALLVGSFSKYCYCHHLT